MQKHLTISIFIITLLLFMNIAVRAAIEIYDLSWYSIDCGGGQSSAGSYNLHGSIGQPDAGVSSGGEYTLAGGFWNKTISSSPERTIYLPLVNH